MLTSQTQLKGVELHNINLETAIADLPDLLPSSMYALGLVNVLLSTFPSHLGNMSNLQYLYVVTPAVNDTSHENCIDRSNNDPLQGTCRSTTSRRSTRATASTSSSICTFHDEDRGVNYLMIVRGNHSELQYNNVTSFEGNFPLLTTL